MGKRTVTDYPRNEAGLVDEFIGTAYDVVKGVYDNLDQIQTVYEAIETIDTLAEDAVEAAMVPARVEMQTAIGQAEQFADAAALSAVDAALSAALTVEMRGKSLAFKKTVKAFPYRHPQYDMAVSLFGSIYPQSFHIDTLANEVLFLSATGQVTVFNWETKAYVKTYNCPTPFVSENIVLKYIAGQRLMYLRGNGVISVYDITATTQWQTLTPVSTIPIAAQRNFAEHAGEWLISNNNVFPLGAYRSRGYYGVYTSDFTQIGDLWLSPLQCGINEGPSGEGSISKMQGMDFDGSTIYLGMGGYWDGMGFSNKRYGAYGVRTLSRQGYVTGDYLLDPEKVVAKMNSLGFKPKHCENEGVQFIKSTGQIYSLMVGLQSNDPTNLTQVEGLYLLEEFSAATDAYDFSDCATSQSSFPEVLRDSSQLFPRSGAGLVNPLTGVLFTTWAQVLDYMRSVDMSVFRYYSSSIALTDFNGVALPGGYLVTISNSNNTTFWVDATTFNSTRRYRLLYGSTQLEHQWRPNTAFVPETNNTVTCGSSSLQWSDVRSVLGTFTGPLKLGHFTLATLPNVATYNGSIITVTDATGGAKVCRSNGFFWQILNTSTTVS